MVADKPHYWTVKRPGQPLFTVYSQAKMLDEFAKPGPVDIAIRIRTKKYELSVGERIGTYRQEFYADFGAVIDTAKELHAAGHAFVEVRSMYGRRALWVNGSYTDAMQDYP